MITTLPDVCCSLSALVGVGYLSSKFFLGSIVFLCLCILLKNACPPRSGMGMM